MDHNNRKLPFQSPPPNKIIYQDDYSSPQLVFLPQTPESSGQNNNTIRFADFDDQPLTPIVSTSHESVWNQGIDDENSKGSSSELDSNMEASEKIESSDGTVFCNERPISPIPNKKHLTEEENSDVNLNDSMNLDDERVSFQQGERIDINDKASIKKNKKNKMIKMIDEDEDEYDDPFAHVPDIVVSEEVLQTYNDTISNPVSTKEDNQPTSSITINKQPPMERVKSSSSIAKSKPSSVEEFGFRREDSMHDVELVEVKSSKKIQDRFSNLVNEVEKLGNKLLSPTINRNRDSGDIDEYELTSDKKKMLSDDRGNTMSGIFEKLSSFKLNTSTIPETVPKEQPPQTEEEEEDSFLNDIILSSSQNQNTSFNKQPYLPNANIPSQTPTNTSFMGQSWVDKLKRIDVSAEIAHEFFVSCQESDLDSVKSYIEEKNFNINTKDLMGYGQTALHYASWNGNLKLVEYLLSKEASVNALNDYKQTPLHEAAFRGHPDIVSLLLKSGADKSCRDHVGETALEYAKKKRNEATNFTSESLFKDVIKVLDSHIDSSNARKRTIPCCFQ